MCVLKQCQIFSVWTIIAWDNGAADGGLVLRERRCNKKIICLKHVLSEWKKTGNKYENVV